MSLFSRSLCSNVEDTTNKMPGGVPKKIQQDTRDSVTRRGLFCSNKTFFKGGHLNKNCNKVKERITYKELGGEVRPNSGNIVNWVCRKTSMVHNPKMLNLRQSRHG